MGGVSSAAALPHDESWEDSVCSTSSQDASLPVWNMSALVSKLKLTWNKIWITVFIDPYIAALEGHFTKASDQAARFDGKAEYVWMAAAGSAQTNGWRHTGHTS